MKQTHTPGPWHIADSSEIHDESGQPICSIAHEENSNLDSKTANANARLIAAAPDLLACLIAAEQEIRLTAAICEQENKPETAKALRSHAAFYAIAIAKAEGTL